ncbi:MAG: sensor histidine kinase [Chloroflexi bacterium]|nr:sensor histidine kinase [Chloroflexota bacterium]MBV9896250.1 sensor histidine kinase [Chloroflexota bacterium]
MNPVRRVWNWILRIDPRLLDGALAVALAVGANLQLLSEEPGDYRVLFTGTFTCLPLVVRRRYPLGMHFAQIAAASLGARQPVALSLVAIFIGVYSVAVYSRWRWPYLIWLVIGATILGILFPESSPSMPAWALQLVGGFGLWLAGNSVRQRGMQAAMLEERAIRLERERELSMRVARADERERIARELHDVVAHSVSVMVVQAGAARTLIASQPQKSVDALLAVEASGRDALRELRNLLGLLTAVDDQPALAPQPGLDQLQPLIDRMSQAGLPIDMHVEGTPHPLPPGLDLTAYRIVQEALTNVLKYASGARTSVVLKFADDQLQLEVVDTGGALSDGANGSGRGLIGMRERVTMYGGQLEVGPRAEGGFRVLARLPLQVA